MSPIASFALPILLLLAMLGASAGILLENRRIAGRPLWQNPGLRDALLPVGGWCSLFALDVLVRLLGVEHLPLGCKYLLGTLALLLLYYAVLSTLYLICRSGMRILAGIQSGKEPTALPRVPFLSRLAFPIMFVSAALAALSVLHYDGLSQNFAFIGCIVVVTGAIPRRAMQRGPTFG